MEFGDRDICSKKGNSNTNTPLWWPSKRKRCWKPAKQRQNTLKVSTAISAGKQNVWSTSTQGSRNILTSSCGNHGRCPFSKSRKMFSSKERGSYHCSLLPSASFCSFFCFLLGAHFQTEQMLARIWWQKNGKGDKTTWEDEKEETWRTEETVLAMLLLKGKNKAKPGRMQTRAEWLTALP